MKTGTSMLMLVCWFSGWLRPAVTAQPGTEEGPPAITWGSPTTNGIKAGLAFYAPQRNRNPLCLVYLLNTGTNYLRFNYPDTRQMLTITLRDSAGKAVRRTESGRRLGEPLDSRANARNRPHSWAGPFGIPTQAKNFPIDEFFIIERPGEYELEVKTALYYDDRSRPFKPFQPFYVPSVTAKVQLWPKTSR